MSSCHSRPWREWVVRPLDSGLRRAATGVLPSHRIPDFLSIAATGVLPSHRIPDFLSINDGGWILACAGMTAGWIPRPFIPGSALPPRPLVPDAVYRLHPCRRASMQASFCRNNTPRLPLPRLDHAAGAGQAVQQDDQAEAEQQHDHRIQELRVVMIRPMRR